MEICLLAYVPLPLNHAPLQPLCSGTLGCHKRSAGGSYISRTMGACEMPLAAQGALSKKQLMACHDNFSAFSVCRERKLLSSTETGDGAWGASDVLEKRRCRLIGLGEDFQQGPS